MRITRWLAILLTLFLVSPLLIVALHISNFQTPDINDFLWALRQTVEQAAGSAFFSIVFGIVMAFGLAKASEGKRSLIAALSIAPSVMPAMLSILIVLMIARPFPAGTWGIIITHTYIYAGFAAYQLFNLFEERALGLIEVSYVLGVSRLRLYFEIIRMLKLEIISLFFVIFTVSFASFSVPIAVGGGRGTTLEVLIYEKIRLSGDWGQAIGICIFQILILFTFSLVQRKNTLSIQDTRSKATTAYGWYGNHIGLMTIIGYILSMIIGIFVFTIEGWQKTLQMPGLFESVFSVLPTTIAFAVLTGAFASFFLMTSAYLCDERWLHRFLKGLVAPSLSLIGFSLILIRAENHFSQILIYCFGFSIFIFPSLYRFSFESALSGIRGQIEVAKTLGASNTLTFKEIIFPQVFPVAMKMGGLASIWLIGDFALSKYAFTEDKVIGQVVYSLMNSFRIEQAMFIMTINLVLGFIIYYLFARVGDVISKKS